MGVGKNGRRRTGIIYNSPLTALMVSVVVVIPSEARLYPGSIEIFRRRRRRRRRRQPEVGLKTSISQEWCRVDAGIMSQRVLWVHM